MCRSPSYAVQSTSQLSIMLPRPLLQHQITKLNMVTRVKNRLRTSRSVSHGVPVMDAGSAFDLVEEGGAEEAEVADGHTQILRHAV